MSVHKGTRGQVPNWIAENDWSVEQRLKWVHNIMAFSSRDWSSYPHAEGGAPDSEMWALWCLICSDKKSEALESWWKHCDGDDVRPELNESDCKHEWRPEGDLWVCRLCQEALDVPPAGTYAPRDVERAPRVDQVRIPTEWLADCRVIRVDRTVRPQLVTVALKPVPDEDFIVKLSDGEAARLGRASKADHENWGDVNRAATIVLHDIGQRALEGSPVPAPMTLDQIEEFLDRLDAPPFTDEQAERLIAKLHERMGR